MIFLKHHQVTRIGMNQQLTGGVSSFQLRVGKLVAKLFYLNYAKRVISDCYQTTVDASLGSERTDTTQTWIVKWDYLMMLHIDVAQEGSITKCNNSFISIHANLCQFYRPRTK
jgi:hypothetical protein